MNKQRSIVLGLAVLVLSGAQVVAASHALAQAAAKGSPKRILASVGDTQGSSGGSIIVSQVLVTSVPGGSRAAFRCVSRCSRPYSITRTGSGSITLRLNDLKVSNGAVAILRVTKLKYIGFYDRLVFHIGGTFSQKPSCMAPGGSDPVSCKGLVQSQSKPVPSPPTGVTPGTASTTSIPVTWTASTGKGFIGYELYVNGKSVGRTTATSYTFTGLSCATTYKLGVQAYIASKTSRVVSASASTSACPPYHVQSCWSQYTDDNDNNVNPASAATTFVGSDIIANPNNYWAIVQFDAPSTIVIDGATLTLIWPNGGTSPTVTFNMPYHTARVHDTFDWTYDDGTLFFGYPGITGSGTWTWRWAFPDGETCNNSFTVS